jgi:hypothetical protein
MGFKHMMEESEREVVDVFAVMLWIRNLLRLNSA